MIQCHDSGYKYFCRHPHARTYGTGYRDEPETAGTAIGNSWQRMVQCGNTSMGHRKATFSARLGMARRSCLQPEGCRYRRMWTGCPCRCAFVRTADRVSETCGTGRRSRQTADHTLRKSMAHIAGAQRQDAGQRPQNHTWIPWQTAAGPPVTRCRIRSLLRQTLQSGIIPQHTVGQTVPRK